MTELLFVRHGTTAWNEAGRIQGRSDIVLAESGREQVRRWRMPERFRMAECVTSQLLRARETAELLGFADARVDVRLREMDWGAYEGMTLEELRAPRGPMQPEDEGQGLDFRPPDGESPRDVTIRLGDFLYELVGAGRPQVLVAHKGVLRAAIVLACGWDMLGKPPLRLRDDHGLIAELAADGSLGSAGLVDLLHYSG